MWGSFPGLPRSSLGSASSDATAQWHTVPSHGRQTSSAPVAAWRALEIVALLFRAYRLSITGLFGAHHGEGNRLEQELLHMFVGVAEQAVDVLHRGPYVCLTGLIYVSQIVDARERRDRHFWGRLGLSLIYLKPGKA